MDQGTIDMQNDIVALRRSVHDLQLRISALERRAYAEPLAQEWPPMLTPMLTPPFVVTGDTTSGRAI